jgi:hypothetical protein
VFGSRWSSSLEAALAVRESASGGQLVQLVRGK